MNTADELAQPPTNAQIIQNYVIYFQKNLNPYPRRVTTHRLNITDKLG